MVCVVVKLAWLRNDARHCETEEGFITTRVVMKPGKFAYFPLLSVTKAKYDKVCVYYWL